MTWTNALIPRESSKSIKLGREVAAGLVFRRRASSFRQLGAPSGQNQMKGTFSEDWRLPSTTAETLSWSIIDCKSLPAKTGRVVLPIMKVDSLQVDGGFAGISSRIKIVKLTNRLAPRTLPFQDDFLPIVFQTQVYRITSAKPNGSRIARPSW